MIDTDNDVNDIKVTVISDVIRGYVNNTLLVSRSGGSSFANKKVSIVAKAGTGDITARFDKFSIDKV